MTETKDGDPSVVQSPVVRPEATADDVVKKYEDLWAERRAGTNKASQKSAKFVTAGAIAAGAAIVTVVTPSVIQAAGTDFLQDLGHPYQPGKDKALKTDNQNFKVQPERGINEPEKSGGKVEHQVMPVDGAGEVIPKNPDGFYPIFAQQFGGEQFQVAEDTEGKLIGIAPELQALAFTNGIDTTVVVPTKGGLLNTNGDSPEVLKDATTGLSLMQIIKKVDKSKPDGLNRTVQLGHLFIPKGSLGITSKEVRDADPKTNPKYGDLGKASHPMIIQNDSEHPSINGWIYVKAWDDTSGKLIEGWTYQGDKLEGKFGIEIVSNGITTRDKPAEAAPANPVQNPGKPENQTPKITGEKLPAGIAEFPSRVIYKQENGSWKAFTEKGVQIAELVDNSGKKFPKFAEKFWQINVPLPEGDCSPQEVMQSVEKAMSQSSLSDSEKSFLRDTYAKYLPTFKPSERQLFNRIVNLMPSGGDMGLGGDWSVGLSDKTLGRTSGWDVDFRQKWAIISTMHNLLHSWQREMSESFCSPEFDVEWQAYQLSLELMDRYGISGNPRNDYQNKLNSRSYPTCFG